MNKLLVWLGVAAAAVGTSFGYSDDDLDAEGHQYNDETYYVQGTNTWWCDAGRWMWDLPATWSDGLAPHAQKTDGPNDYYMQHGFALGLGAHWGYACSNGAQYINPETGKPFYNRFAGKSLTLGPAAYIAFSANGNPVDQYTFYIDDLRMREDSRLNCWGGATGGAFGGKITVLSQDEMSPAFIVGGKNAGPTLIKSTLVAGSLEELEDGAPAYWLRAMGFVDSTDGPGARVGNIIFSGNADDFWGTLAVGADCHVIFAADMPNVEVVVDGAYYGPQNSVFIGTNLVNSAIGLSKTGKTSVKLSMLHMEDGAQIVCGGIVTNRAGFVVTDYFEQKGAMTLDFGNLELTAKTYPIVSAPADPDSGSSPFDLSKITVINQPDEDYELTVEASESGYTLALKNSSVIEGDYVELVRDDANIANKGYRDENGDLWPASHWSSGKQKDSRDCSDYAIYYGTNYWANGLLPSIEDGMNHDYLIPMGMALFQPLEWAIGVNGEHSAGRTTDEYGHYDYGKFYGKSLTIAGGAALSLEATDSQVSAFNYCFQTPDLRLMAGSQIRHDLNGWLNAYIYMRYGKMTINGTEKKPVKLWLSNTRNSDPMACGLYNLMDLAGAGVLYVSTGALKAYDNNGTWMNSDMSADFRHVVAFYGANNSAFTGTIKVGALEDDSLAAPSLLGNVDLYLGCSGLPNGTLQFLDSNPRLGVCGGSNAVVPVNNLILAEGTTICADTIINNNAGYGIKVTGTYTQQGIVTVDVNNVSMSVHRLYLLTVPPTAGDLDPSKFVLVNNPDSDVQCKVETTVGGSKVLSLVKESVKMKTVNPSMWSHIDTLYTFGEDDVVDTTIVNVKVVNEQSLWMTGDDWYRFYTKTEGGVTTLYGENLLCVENGNYDYCFNGNDGAGQSSFDTTGFWFKKVDGSLIAATEPPHAGASYYMQRWKSMRINDDTPKTFAGDTLTLGDDPATVIANSAYAYLLAASKNVDITVNDLRLFDGAYCQMNAGSSSETFTIRGLMRILSTQVPVFFKPNGDNQRFIIYSTIVGGSARIFKTREGNSGCGIDLMGDASGYYGQALIQDGFTLGLGSVGLPNATATLNASTSAIRALNTKAAVPVKTLEMADGATIKADTSAYGLAVTTFTPAGKVNLDFGSKAAGSAETITVLTVPADAALSTDTFTIVKALNNYTLNVVKGNGVKSLIYTKGVVKQQGTAVLLK